MMTPAKLSLATLASARSSRLPMAAGVAAALCLALAPSSGAQGGASEACPNESQAPIAGTNNPETIGRAASHGCIRTANWDAARIKDFVGKGNVVEIF